VAKQILVMALDADVEKVVQASFDDSRVLVAGTVDEARSIAAHQRFEYAFVDVNVLKPLADRDDHEGCLHAFRQIVPGARVVVLSAQKDIREAVDFVRGGASDYLTYPVLREEVQLTRDSIERHEHFRSELSYLRGRAWQSEAVGAVRSRADSMTSVLHKVRQVAPTRSTVLLTGETGTGKSFLAKVIHQSSTRADRQLISIHCGAIPDTLLESELFGHERGSFTGADRRKLGKFEVADGGTLFLDEVATITPAMQVKLLHVLQERTIQRIGGKGDIEIDVRILAATNMDLDKLTADGVFRNDLYYRLNVFPIEIPPLRDRREDIPVLVDVFLNRLRGIYTKEIHATHPSVMDAFLDYSWPGNVRELENLLERAFILETSKTLMPENFPEELFESQSVGRVLVDTDSSLASARKQAAEDAERMYLREQLASHRGRIDATAAAAGVTSRQLHKLMTKHGLKKEDFKSEPVAPRTTDTSR
jgi:DNA-binding NtrC family response regulator